MSGGRSVAAATTAAVRRQAPAAPARESRAPRECASCSIRRDGDDGPAIAAVTQIDREAVADGEGDGRRRTRHRAWASPDAPALDEPGQHRAGCASRSRPASFHRARPRPAATISCTRSPPGRDGALPLRVRDRQPDDRAPRRHRRPRRRRPRGSPARSRPAPTGAMRLEISTRTPRQVVVEDAGAPGSHTGNCISVAARPSVLAQEHRRVEPRRRSRRQPHRHQRDRRQDAGDRGRRPRIADVDAEEQRAERRRQRRRVEADGQSEGGQRGRPPITDRTICTRRRAAPAGAPSPAADRGRCGPPPRTGRGLTGSSPVPASTVTSWTRCARVRCARNRSSIVRTS